jgi:hypothetical protein
MAALEKSISRAESTKFVSNETAKSKTVEHGNSTTNTI